MSKTKLISGTELHSDEEVQHLRHRETGAKFETRVRSDGVIVTDKQTEEHFLLSADAHDVIKFINERMDIFKKSGRLPPKSSQN